MFHFQIFVLIKSVWFKAFYAKSSTDHRGDRLLEVVSNFITTSNMLLRRQI